MKIRTGVKVPESAQSTPQRLDGDRKLSRCLPNTRTCVPNDRSQRLYLSCPSFCAGDSGEQGGRGGPSQEEEKEE